MNEEVTTAAVVVLHDDRATATAWFEAVQRAYAAAGGADAWWDGFVAALRAEVATESLLSDDTVTAFADVHGRTSDPMAAVRELADPQHLDALLTLHDEAVAAAHEEHDDHEHGHDHEDGDDEHAAAHAAEVAELTAVAALHDVTYTEDTVEFDEGVWFSYLAQWTGGWDGEEPTYWGFAEGFLTHAPDGCHRAATFLVRDLDSAPLETRPAMLAGYGIEIGPQTIADAVDEAFEGAFDEELATGALDAARHEPAAENAAAHDHAVVAVEPDTVEVDEHDEPGVPGPVSHTFDLNEHADAIADEVIAPALAELFAEVPEAAELSPEELQALIAEVLTEQYATTPAG